MMNTFTDFVLDEQETEKQVKEAKINQAILGWFESWQSWQQRMLISGIVSRFNEAQLECLLVAVEPVFHRDFVTSVKKVYPIYDAGQTKVSMNPEEDGKINKKMWILKKQIQKTIGKEKINIYEYEIKEVEDVHLGRISSEHTVEASLPFANARARPVRRGSSADSMTSLSTIEEGSSKRDADETGGMSALDGKIAEEDLNKMETPDLMECERLEDDNIQNSMTSQLVCHLMSEVRSSGTSQVSTLVSSLSPIEETSPEASGSMDTEKSTPVGTEEETLFGDSLRKLKPEEKKESKKKKKKKKQKKKVDPDTVVEKLVSSSSWAERVLQSASNKSVEEITKREESILDFRSGPASVDVRVDDFFENRKNDILGKPVSTRSKVGVSFKQTYDTRRNPLPIPTTQQLYKSKKFWERKTVKARTGRLKEQFQQQLVEIWTWLADWPAYQRIRLLLLLFSHSGEEMVKYAAECVKHKSRQLEEMKSSIDILSDPMLLSIFQHLNPCDLMQASNVCKRWNYLLQSDAVWMKKCDELGVLYGIPNLVNLLVGSAGGNWTLDWKKACEEVYEYLKINVEPVVGTWNTEQLEEEEEYEEEEEEEEAEDRFKDYVPFWKAFPQDEEDNNAPHRDSSERKDSKGRVTRKIKDVNLDDEADYACLEVDMFKDMQEWSDVELMTNIGQRFAVDFHDEDALKECAKSWSIRDHVIKVRKVNVWKGHTGSVNVVKYDGNRVFSGSSDRQVRVWTRRGECFAKLTGQIKGGINDISLSPADESRILYTASWDMSIRVWNTVSFKQKRTVTGHRGSVARIAADSKFVVTCSHDGSIRVWNRKSLKCERTITCHCGEIECMVYHNRMIITGGVDRRICIHNSFTGRSIQALNGHQSPVTALKRQHDLLISGDLLGNVFFWSLTSGYDWPKDQIIAHESRINAIVMHGPTFFTASNDALVKEWDLMTLTTVRIFQGHTDAIMDVEWTDKFLLTASRDNDVRVWWWKGAKDEDEDGQKDE